MLMISESFAPNWKSHKFYHVKLLLDAFIIELLNNLYLIFKKNTHTQVIVLKTTQVSSMGVTGQLYEF